MAPDTRSAVVTGAANGIGLAVAERLLGDGYAVVGLDRDEVSLARAGRRLGESFIPVAGDITAEADLRRAADAAAAAGPLRAWVNNAGIDLVAFAHEASPAHLEHGLRVLQLGPMLGLAEAVRRMAAGGGGSSSPSPPSRAAPRSPATSSMARPRPRCCRRRGASRLTTPPPGSGATPSCPV